MFLVQFTLTEINEDDMLDYSEPFFHDGEWITDGIKIYAPIYKLDWETFDLNNNGFEDWVYDYTQETDFLEYLLNVWSDKSNPLTLLAEVTREYTSWYDDYVEQEIKWYKIETLEGLKDGT